MKKLLDVKGLRIAFHSHGDSKEVVKGINFSVEEGGKTVAILGESGSGKSVSCLSLTKLLPRPPVCSIEGEILFDGENVLKMSEDEVRRLRGEGIAYIFQEASLWMTVFRTSFSFINLY